MLMKISSHPGHGNQIKSLNKGNRHSIVPLRIVKHKKDQAVPNPARHPAPGAGYVHLPP